MSMLEYNPQRTLEYINMVKKHAKTISDVNELIRQNNTDLIDTLSKSILIAIQLINLKKWLRIY